MKLASSWALGRFPDFGDSANITVLLSTMAEKRAAPRCVLPAPRLLTTLTPLLAALPGPPFKVANQRRGRWRCGGRRARPRCVFSPLGVCHKAGGAAAPRVGGGPLGACLGGGVGGWRGGPWALPRGGLRERAVAVAILAQAALRSSAPPFSRPPFRFPGIPIRKGGALWRGTVLTAGRGWGSARGPPALDLGRGTAPRSTRVPRAREL